MRKPKYRVDTINAATPTSIRQMLFEDFLDELGEEGWHFVSAFVSDGQLWIISKRSWWRLLPLCAFLHGIAQLGTLRS